MPANLSPEYKKAQEEFRRSREPKERLEWLREMLRTIPKHKGTEHLQADIRTRIKELTEELQAPRKGGARGGPAVSVRPEGAAQAVLLGPPNSGKSSLHVRLTGSHAVVGPYPFATKHPLPGMMPYLDIKLQIVDLPPISADYMEPWMGAALEHADAALLVVDLSDAGCVEQTSALVERLRGKSVSLGPPSEVAVSTAADTDESAAEDPFRIHLPTVLLASKCELLSDPTSEVATFLELLDFRFPALLVSADTGAGLDRIGETIVGIAGIVRVYSKVPGHPADMGHPFTIRRGGTVRDVARQIHRGLAAEVKFARLWGSGKFDGVEVSPDHPLRDGDVVEIHA